MSLVHEPSPAASAPSSTARAERILARCHELACITDTPGETTRLFLSPATRRAHGLVRGWMVAAGLTVNTDAIGNLRGLLPGTAPDAPRLLLGSHIDTVPNAGAYDGPLGVLLGLALLEQIHAEIGAGSPLPFAVELIAFSEEEGVRFAQPFLGSLALVGALDAATLARTDSAGTTLAQAIRDFGLDPAALPAAVAESSAWAYLEFHIEQGPLLESEGRALAVVEAIAGQSRLELLFTGQANHAGTTPMGPLRHDALAAAAEWIVEVERCATATPGLVATVGKLAGPAGAGNVIAGGFRASLDVRHAEDGIRRRAVEHLVDFATQCAARRGIGLSHAVLLEQSAIPLDSALVARLAENVAKVTGAPARRMVSGAGHDAMIVARRIPSAMLFLRSPGGLSHHPAEAVLPEDVEAAVAVGLEFLRSLRDDRATPEPPIPRVASTKE